MRLTNMLRTHTKTCGFPAAGTLSDFDAPLVKAKLAKGVFELQCGLNRSCHGSIREKAGRILEEAEKAAAEKASTPDRASYHMSLLPLIEESVRALEQSSDRKPPFPKSSS